MEHIDSNSKQENKQEAKNPMFRIVHGDEPEFNSNEAGRDEEYVETAEDYIIEDDDPLGELFEEEAWKRADELARACGVSEVRIRKRAREREREKARRRAEKEVLGTGEGNDAESVKSSETKAAASGGRVACCKVSVFCIGLKRKNCRNCDKKTILRYGAGWFSLIVRLAAHVSTHHHYRGAA